MRPPIAPGAAPVRSVLRRGLGPQLGPQLRPQPRFRRYQSSSRPKADNVETGEHIPVPNTVAPLPLWQRLGPLTTVAMAYARAQKRRPWGTQFVSALVTYLVADLTAQSIGSEDDLDPKRTMRSLVIGGIVAIPSYSWYVPVPPPLVHAPSTSTLTPFSPSRFLWLSHNFNYSSRLLSLATKILVNQVIFTPTFNIYFFGAQAVLSGCSPAGVVERVVNTVPTSIANATCFWPIVTAFSFTFIPIEYRSVFSGVIAIGWQTYLALLNRRAEALTGDRAVVSVEGAAEKAVEE